MLVQIPEHHFVSHISPPFWRITAVPQHVARADEVSQEAQKQSTIKDGETHK